MSIAAKKIKINTAKDLCSTTSCLCLFFLFLSLRLEVEWVEALIVLVV
jgi:hypothetical protein